MMNSPDAELISRQVAAALEEDIGAGDLTAGLIDAQSVSRVEVISREKAVLCGIPWFDGVIRQLDPAVHIEWRASESDQVQAGQLICSVHGNTRALLSAERTALNYLQTL